MPTQAGSEWPVSRVRVMLTLGFVIGSPLITFILLWLKGFPAFAEPHLGVVLIWVYSVTWKPTLLAGLLLSQTVISLIRRGGYFHRPYDFGRSFSLGAIVGAVLETLATLLYRAVSHRPFSDFWVAGAAIAGCLAGAIITSLVLWRTSANILRNSLQNRLSKSH